MPADISAIRDVPGFIGAFLVDSRTGLVLEGEHGGTGFDVEAAGAATSGVVRAKTAAMRALGVAESIEDILIALPGQYHLIRPLTSNNALFLFLALDRKSAKLGKARQALRHVDAAVAP